MVNPRIKSETAFTYHCMGLSNDEISKIVKTTPTTISRWKYKYNWEERVKEIQQVLREVGDENVILAKKRQLRFTQLMQVKGIQGVNDDKIKLSGGDIVSSMKHEMVLLGEPSERINNTSLPTSDISKVYDELMRKRANAERENRESSDTK